MQAISERSGIKIGVLEELRSLAQKYQLQKVILFGSRAHGDFKRTSDIDLAVQGGTKHCFLWTRRILRPHF